jgi:hypothetical protein
MSPLDQRKKVITETVDPRWKDLYKIGGIVCVLAEIITILGIIAYIKWPYSPGFDTTANIFTLIQNDKLAGLIKLDFLLLLGNLVGIMLFLALYVSLKRVNESYALIALVLGLLADILIIPSRPIVEIFSLSNLFTTATTEAARSQYLAAGEALFSLFNGTAWYINTLLGGISFLISSFLMLRSKIFSRSTAYVGIITNIAVCGFIVPGIVGMVLLFLSLPGFLIWYIQLARKFFKLSQIKSEVE